MKQLLLLLILVVISTSLLTSQTDNVGIGTTTPDPSAASVNFEAHVLSAPLTLFKKASLGANSINFFKMDFWIMNLRL